MYKKSGGVFLPAKDIRFGVLQIGRLRNGFQDPSQRTVWNVEGQIILKGQTSFGRGSRIDVGKNGILELGENFNTSGNVTIVCQESVKFGRDCLLAWDIMIMDSDFHVLNVTEKHNNSMTSPICFGDHNWFCYGVNVIKGVTLGDNNVISAKSFLTKPIDCNNALIVGNTVRKENISWHF